MKKIAALIICIHFFVQVFAQQDTRDWQLFTDSLHGVSMKCPPAWTIKTTNPKVRVVFKSPSEGPDDTFNENLNLIIKEIPSSEKVTMASLTSVILETIPNAVDSFSLLYNKNMKWNGIAAAEFSYSGLTKEEKLPVVFLQRIALSKGKFFVATYTSRNNNNTEFLDIAKRILATIKW